MGFPTSPDDGDEYTNALGTKYKYQAADDKWYIMSITAGDLSHNELANLNAGIDFEHITQGQKDLLHAIYTLEVHNNTKHSPNYSAEGHDHVEGDITDLDHLTEGEINLANLLEKNHVSLTNKNAEANVKHLTDAQLAALHARLHTMVNILDHSATNHRLFYSDGAGHIIELAFGDDGEVLTSTGVATAPAFEAPTGGGGVYVPVNTDITGLTADDATIDTIDISGSMPDGAINALGIFQIIVSDNSTNQYGRVYPTDEDKNSGVSVRNQVADIQIIAQGVCRINSGEVNTHFSNILTTHQLFFVGYWKEIGL